MKKAADFGKIFLFSKPADMRKQAYGLASYVQDFYGEDFLSDAVFIFCNKRRNLIKAVYFDRSGFCLWSKRLDQNTFPWPKDGDINKLVLSAEDIDLVFQGVDVFKRHPALNFSSVS